MTARTSGMAPGTPAFQAPEGVYYTGKRPQPSADMWSLCATLIELWSETWPRRTTFASIQGTYEKKGQLPGLAKVPEEMKGVLAVGLAYDPLQRPTPHGLGVLIGQLYQEEEFFREKVFV